MHAAVLHDVIDTRYNNDGFLTNQQHIKNASIGLDLLIMFQTIKIVLLGRGGR